MLMIDVKMPDGTIRAWPASEDFIAITPILEETEKKLRTIAPDFMPGYHLVQTLRGWEAVPVRTYSLEETYEMGSSDPQKSNNAEGTDK